MTSKNFIDIGVSVVDCDYRGVKVLLLNFGSDNFLIKKGNRIAQPIVEKVKSPKVVEMNTLEDTSKRFNGFGSTSIESPRKMDQEKVLTIRDCCLLLKDFHTLVGKMETPMMKKQVSKLLSASVELFEKPQKSSPRGGLFDHEVKLAKRAKAVSLQFYRHPPEGYLEIQKQIAHLLDKGLIEKSTSSYWAPVVFVNKKNSSRRIAPEE